MASSTDLQFLDFNGASEEEILHITKILFGPNKKSLVEFPWQTGGGKCCESKRIADTEKREELSPEYKNEVGSNVIYHDLTDQDPPIVSHIVCMNTGNALMVTTGMPNAAIQAELVPQPAGHMFVPSPRPVESDKPRGKKLKKRNEKENARTEIPYQDQQQQQHMTVPIAISPRVSIPMVTQPIAYPIAAAHNMQPISYQFYTSPMVYANTPHMYNFVTPAAMYQSYPANFLGTVAVTNELGAVPNNCAMHLAPCDVPVYDDDKKPVPEEEDEEEVVAVDEPQVPSDNTEEKKEEQPTESDNKSVNNEVTQTEEIVETNDDDVGSSLVNGPVESPNKSEGEIVTNDNNDNDNDDNDVVSSNSNVEGGATLRTWASLFEKPSSVCANSDTRTTTIATTTNGTVKPVHREKNQTNAIKREVIQEKRVSSNETFPSELKEFLTTIQLDHHSVHILPRGLTNSGNWCYINATLQALLACPPFFNLMRQIPVVAGLKAKNSSPIPVIDAIVEFFHEFVPLMNVSKSSKNDVKMKEEFVRGEPFEPKYVYDMLRAINKSDSFQGKQEDAEEFLSCILNRLHEEMSEVISTASLGNNRLKNGDTITNDRTNHAPDDDSDWQVMGYKNKSCITREVKCTQSPIFEIFGGTMRSMLQQAGSKSSATLQPFFTLQLDIQPENVTCIKSALESLVVKESLQGYTCGSTRQEVEASRKITLEKLPNILILHLKRFVCDRSGCRKLLKKIDFGIDLELSKDLLSSVGKSLHKQRKYRLFAVVYHKGQDLAKGHYITDFYHGGFKSWIRADDSTIEQITEANVMKHSPPRLPYLLYYRNIDTIP